jgi:hypothetical protein
MHENQTCHGLLHEQPSQQADEALIPMIMADIWSFQGLAWGFEEGGSLRARGSSVGGKYLDICRRQIEVWKVKHGEQIATSQ